MLLPFNFLLLWFSLLPFAQYEFPPELEDREIGAVLNRSLTRVIQWDCTLGEQELHFVVFDGPGPSDWDYMEKTETVAFKVVSVAPKYPDVLYVVGEYETGHTVVERWRVSVLRPMTGSPQIRNTKQMKVWSSAITHVRAAAVSPNENFVVILDHATSNVYRLDLPSAAVTIIATPSVYPELTGFYALAWKEHITRGDVFIVTKGNRWAQDLTTPPKPFLMIWDHNLDGTPEVIESLTGNEYLDNGYDLLDSWHPDREFFGSDDPIG